MAFRPSIVFESESAPPSVDSRAITGRAFVAGVTERGSANHAVRIRSLPDFVAEFGGRVNYGDLFDWAETFFRHGGADVYMARVLGDDAAPATITLKDATTPVPADVLEVEAKSPGEWGNALSVAVVAGVAPGTFSLVVSRGGQVIESSPDLATNDDAVAWGTRAVNVTVGKIADADPAVAAAAPLTGGTIDLAGIDNDAWDLAVSRFTAGLGAGQLALAGNTTPEGHAILKENASRVAKRVALLDLPDTPTDADLASAVTASRDGLTDTYAMALAPKIIVPGVAYGTTREVWPSAVAAGLMARTDSETGNANVPAAGPRGLSRWAIGVKHTWSDEQYDALNTAGVMTFREIDGVRLYGYRSTLSPSAPDQAYSSFNNSRLRAQIFSLAEMRAQNYMLQDITRRSLAALAVEITGDMQELYKAGAFYGDTPAESFAVDTGPGVNTPATMANREIHVKIQARMTQFAELVTITLVFVPLTQEVA